MKVKCNVADPFNETQTCFETEQEVKNYIRDCGWFTYREIKDMLTLIRKEGFLIV